MVFGNAPLSVGTAPADAIKRRHGDAETVGGQARSLLRTEAQRMRFDAQWRFADYRSESAGESLSRVIIYGARGPVGQDALVREERCEDAVRRHDRSD